MESFQFIWRHPHCGFHSHTMMLLRWQILGWPFPQPEWVSSMKSCRSSGPPQKHSSCGNSPTCEISWSFQYYPVMEQRDDRCTKMWFSGAMFGHLESWCLSCWALGRCPTARPRWPTTRPGWRRSGSKRFLSHQDDNIRKLDYLHSLWDSAHENYLYLKSHILNSQHGCSMHCNDDIWYDRLYQAQGKKLAPQHRLRWATKLSSFTRPEQIEKDRNKM